MDEDAFFVCLFLFLFFVFVFVFFKGRDETSVYALVYVLSNLERHFCFVWFGFLMSRSFCGHWNKVSFGSRSFSSSGRCETTDGSCIMPAEGARLKDILF